MLVAQADKVELLEIWSKDDPTQGIRFNFVISTLNGSEGSAVAFTEVDPGKHTGMHKHSAEESHLVLEGIAEIVAGEERERLEKYGVAVVPANAFHEVVNLGDEVLKVMTFLPSAAVVTIPERPVEPGKMTVFVTAPQN